MFGIKQMGWAAMLSACMAPAMAATTGNFNFYVSGGPLIDHVSSAPTYNDGMIGVTLRAYNSSGDQVYVTERWDGLGVDSGGLDLGEINSSLFANPGERLELTFNQAVRIDRIGMSLWEQTFLGAIDQATLQGNLSGSVNLSTNNDGGLLVKNFDFANGPTGTVFNLTAKGAASGFRLANLSVTSVAAVPEPGTWSTLALGMVGIAAVSRRRQPRA